MIARAAVLVPVRRVRGMGLVMTMIRRAEGGPHSGQMAFPGGRHEPYDVSLLDTALRESFEEVGLERSDVEVLGALPEHKTYSSDLIVSPFVARIPHPYDFVADEKEVDRVIDAPLRNFRDPGKRHHLEWQHEGRAVEVPAVTVSGESVWGLSLGIIEDLLESDLVERV